MKLNRDTLETLINYHNSASKDETRPYLCGVAFKILDKQLKIVATDGYCAIWSMHNIEIEKNDFLENEYKIIATDDLKKLKLFLKEYKDCNSFNLSVIENDNTISISIDRSDFSMHEVVFRLINREYPRIDSILSLNKNGDEINSISFNPAILNKIYKSIAPLKKAQNRLKFIEFNFNGDNAPITGKCDLYGIEHNYSIMPVRR